MDLAQVLCKREFDPCHASKIKRAIERSVYYFILTPICVVPLSKVLLLVSHNEAVAYGCLCFIGPDDDRCLIYGLWKPGVTMTPSWSMPGHVTIESNIRHPIIRAALNLNNLASNIECHYFAANRVTLVFLGYCL